MSTTYLPAPAVEDIARGLIHSHHPHLLSAPIYYLFRDPPTKAKGKVKAGTARVVGGLAAYLAPGPVTAEGVSSPTTSFYVIEVALVQWELMTAEARLALVDHELCHINWAGPDEALGLEAHDVEDFVAVIERHGLWNTEVFDLVTAGAQQLNFDLPPD